MKSIHVEAIVKKDGELLLDHLPVEKGQHVRATIEIKSMPSTHKGKVTDLIGLLKGTWGSKEAVDQHLKEERDAWE